MSAPRRPDSARPRTDHVAEPAPPTIDELEAIERHRLDWTLLLGAAPVDVDRLDATLVRHPNPTSGLNFVTQVRWAADEVDAQLERVRELMGEHGSWPAVIVADGLSEPSDLPALLAANGWAAVSGELIMWTRHPTEPPHLDPSLRVEAVTRRTAGECVGLEIEVFGEPANGGAEAERILAEAVESGAVRAYIVRVIHEPVASARLVPGPVVAGLHGIGVRRAHRGRGYGRLVTSVATRAGLITRHRLVWLSVDERNAAAMNLYRSLGYRPAFTWTRWIFRGDAGRT